MELDENNQRKTGEAIESEEEVNRIAEGRAREGNVPNEEYA